MRTTRRISQVLFFLFFVFLFIQARFPYETDLPSDLFLRASALNSVIVLLAGRVFVASLALGVIILALAIPFGRFFCGWICPLGTVIDLTDKIVKRKRQKIRVRPTLRFRWIKFFILAALITAAFFSFQFIWFFDPVAMLTRVFTVAVFPAFVFIVNAAFSFAFTINFLENTVYDVYDFAQRTFFPVNQPYFYQAIPIFFLFLMILSLSLATRRFWCRNFCPLGALLGVFSKYRIWRRYVIDTCTNCGICQRDCRMNAIEDDFTLNNTVECIECAECVSVCPTNAVYYRLGRPSVGINKVDLSRRRLVLASIAGIAGLSLVKAAAKDRKKTGMVLRPPGALPEEKFLDRCVRCQACVRICASTGGCLQPALTESGWEGIWTPVSVPRLGFCEYECNLCGRVCFTGAIQKLDIEVKQKVKIGLAHFDKTRCIPWYRQEDCLVCEEHCPVSDKAIKFDLQKARGPDGTIRAVKFPYVVADLCIGCGICENKCPLEGAAGIYVTRENEQRI
ncbi:4Fe-4S binding protein [candidate division KSB1 bacterium]|nr:4Fe-4S binding protein [candidate division KSB1 bacterium]